MYIIIFEDGSMNKSDTITVDDKSSCSDGYLSIIDTISLKEYYNDEWIDIEYMPK